MITTAFTKLSDGSLDLRNPIIVDTENLPYGCYLLEQGVEYIIPIHEPQPQEYIDSLKQQIEERIVKLEQEQEVIINVLTDIMGV